MIEITEEHKTIELRYVNRNNLTHYRSVNAHGLNRD